MGFACCWWQIKIAVHLASRLAPRKNRIAPVDTYEWAEYVPIFRLRLQAVIARSEATKQSILPLCGEMDCFAEPVIGRAVARPVGSQ
jgi:hypothetical protein